MKNITLAIDEKTYREARIRAAIDDTSLSAVVRDFLRSYTADKNMLQQQLERRNQAIDVLLEKIPNFARAKNMPNREERNAR